MAAKKKMSVEEILASCRKADSDGGAGPEAAEAAADTAPAAAEKPQSASKQPSSASPGSMSVADILAAARAGKPGGEAAESPAAGGDSGAEPPAAAKPAPAKNPGQMSVAEMLAAARGEKSGGTEKAAPAKSAPKPAAKPAAAKKEAAAAPGSGPRDTSSILAAARKSVKPGPVSKAEAAAIKPAGAKPAVVVPPMPSKPDYAKPAKVAETEENRRGFLAVFFGSFLAAGFTLMGTVFGLWGLGLAKFMFPNVRTEPPSKFKVGFPADFAPDTVETKFKAQFGVWIVNAEYEGARMIYALRTVCTHLGCTPNWLEGEQKFKCPCHGSGFYIDGINFEGPAPRPLERFAIRVADDGQLEVDKGKMFQEEMGQWSDPACYVPV